jgi:hypothetical protein
MKNKKTQLSLFKLYDGSKVYGVIQSETLEGWELSNVRIKTLDTYSYIDSIKLSRDAVYIHFRSLK